MQESERHELAEELLTRIQPLDWRDKVAWLERLLAMLSEEKLIALKFAVDMTPTTGEA